MASQGAGSSRSSHSRVAAAIRDAGVNVSTEQVALLSDVVARTRAPVLRVESFGAWEGDLAAVRLECLASDECLPFVVTVRRSGTKNTEGVSVASNPQSLRRSPTDTPKSNLIVRIGSAAVLLLDGGHVHIQLVVICLENGAVGQTIRVTGKGREHTYMAVVGSDGLLRGTL
jgi:hypothetical protein